VSHHEGTEGDECTIMKVRREVNVTIMKEWREVNVTIMKERREVNVTIMGRVT
jgi:hypothetical protein